MANLETVCESLTTTTTSIEQLLNKWKEKGVEQWEAASVLWFFSVLSSECKRNNVQVSPDWDADLLEKRTQDILAKGYETNYFIEDCLKEGLEMEVLESIGLLSSATQWTRRAIRTNTRLFYTQEKFNLLREETEGFAKLITDLFDSPISSNLATKQHARLVSLVGCFDLDPNRVIDLLWSASAFCDETCGELLSLFSTFRSDYISQILGFKFHNCNWNKTSLPTEKDETLSFDSIFSPVLVENSVLPFTEILPLIEVTAEALSRQLIRLCDIWPHLTPEDSLLFTRMTEFFERADDTTAEFGVVSLSEGNTTTRTTRTEQSSKALEDFEQGPFSEVLFSKLELVCALLERGSWDMVVDCMKIWNESFKDKTDFVILLCSHPRYRNVLMAVAEKVLENFLGKVLDLNGVSAPSSKVLKITEEKLTELFGFQKLEDLLYGKMKGMEMRYHVLVYILLSLGPYARQSCRCLFLLSRLVRQLLVQSSLLKNLGVKFLVEVIFPSMSCIKGNPSLSIELWRTMSLLGFDERYQIYHLLKHSVKQEYILVRRANAWTSFETRRVLRRLAKENVKQFGRWLGKICNGNPIVAAECILEQVQSYENLVPVLIDALKYMTPLTLDIIMYCCIEQLESCNRDKIKSDGMNLSQWYYGICIFISGLIRKYFAFLDCRGLFHFIFNKLEEGDSVYIFLLLEILCRVSGGGNTEHLSDSQISSLGGGPLLRELVASSSASLSETKKNSRKAAQMLRNLVISEGLVADLAILVAQQRESILYDSVYREVPLRMICNIFDKCQETLILYTELVLRGEKCWWTSSEASSDNQSHFSSNAEFDMIHFPFFESLIVDYHLPYDSAFLFMRPFLELERIFDTCDIPKFPFYVSCLTKVISDSIWESITPELFSVFWILELYDIYVPKDSYTLELQRLGSIAYTDQDNENDMKYSSHSDIKENRKHRQGGRRVEETLFLLEEEMRNHERHFQKIQNLLYEKKSLFFASTRKNWPIVFLQLCLIPRCISSFSDASFCSRFIEILLELDPPDLRIVPLFHYLLVNVGQIALCLSEAESTRFGNFVADVLKMLNGWWTNESKYLEECSNKAAFSLQSGEQSSTSSSGGMAYSEFAFWNQQVHSIITKNMLSNLNGDNYLAIRNTIEILSRVVKYFPRIASHGMAIQRKLQEVVENETFRVVASRYLSLLQNERSKWIPETDVQCFDSIQWNNDLLDFSCIFSTRQWSNTDLVATTQTHQVDVKDNSEEDPMVSEDTATVHFKRTEQIAPSQETVTSSNSEEMQVTSVHMEESKTSTSEQGKKLNLSQSADPTHAELARIQAAVAEKRQLLQRERERRSRENVVKEEFSQKNTVKESPEPGEITKNSNRSNYKTDPSVSRENSDDLEARKRRRDQGLEEVASTETTRRNKRERADTSYSRNDASTNSTRTRSYTNVVSESNRNRNSRSSYGNQERVSRDTESFNRNRRSSSISEQREKKAEDSDDREDYNSSRLNNRSRKGRK